MSLSQISPLTVPERIEIIDVLRGLAVCGILIGNVQWFSGYGMMPPDMAAAMPLSDQIARFLVHFFIEGKFYSIFSFLFGFGFALQMSGAELRGDKDASLFKRRLFWLLVIGLLHAYLLWAGDILSIYAIVGFMLLLFRRKSDRSLLKWALGLVLVPIVTYVLLFILFVAFAPPETGAAINAAQTEMWDQNVATVGQSGYFEIVTGYNLKYVIGRYMGLILQMRLPKILAMFLLGVYAYRRGYFHDLTTHRQFINGVLKYGLLIGVVANIAFSAVAGNEAPFPPSLSGVAAVVLYAFGVPALALGLVALAVTLWQRTKLRKMLEIFAPVGRMALTNYLLQTLICVFIFYGFGFGQFGKIGSVAATCTALLIFVLQVIASSLWLRHFAYGPVEWLWRQLTYRKRLTLLRSAASS